MCQLEELAVARLHVVFEITVVVGPVLTFEEILVSAGLAALRNVIVDKSLAFSLSVTEIAFVSELLLLSSLHAVPLEQTVLKHAFLEALIDPRASLCSEKLAVAFHLAVLNVADILASVLEVHDADAIGCHFIVALVIWVPRALVGNHFTEFEMIFDLFRVKLNGLQLREKMPFLFVVRLIFPFEFAEQKCFEQVAVVIDVHEVRLQLSSSFFGFLLLIIGLIFAIIRFFGVALLVALCTKAVETVLLRALVTLTFFDVRFGAVFVAVALEFFWKLALFKQVLMVQLRVNINFFGFNTPSFHKFFDFIL